ncbi:MAG: hypothetical protein B7X28_01390 [Halothiobacillus sp. 13-55-253]|jgi:Tfp pilus assembly protein PilZ|nr:MAG: hypothetical protein B7X28_01390 [Halothiobacillus sp. 13-55-253]
MDAGNPTQIDNHQDRRDFNRIKVRGKVLLKCMTPPFEIFNAEIIDVSANGLNISTKNALELNLPVQLSVCTVNDNNVFFMNGKITWCEKSSDGQGEPEYNAGIEIQFDRRNKDYRDWRALYIA